MSCLKKFTHSLLSGYIAPGANIFYTLASVPLALHYPGKPEFGLWALVTQIGGDIFLNSFGSQLIHMPFFPLILKCGRSATRKNLRSAFFNPKSPNQFELIEAMPVATA